MHVRSVTALEPVPAPVQSAAVFRDARSVFIPGPCQFLYFFFGWGVFLLLLLLRRFFIRPCPVSSENGEPIEREREKREQSLYTRHYYYPISFREIYLFIFLN